MPSETTIDLQPTKESKKFQSSFHFLHATSKNLQIQKVVQHKTDCFKTQRHSPSSFNYPLEQIQVATLKVGDTFDADLQRLHTLVDTVEKESPKPLDLRKRNFPQSQHVSSILTDSKSQDLRKSLKRKTQRAPVPKLSLAEAQTATAGRP